MLDITLPHNHVPERRYALTALLQERLGQTIELRVCPDVTETVIRHAHTKGVLRLKDGLFACSSHQWLRPTSIPDGVRMWWHVTQALPTTVLIEDDLPVLFGAPLDDGDEWMRWDDQTGKSAVGPTLTVGADLLGGAFFMLSRYEELAAPARDRLERYPASASLAVRAGFIDRPLVDEYVEVLWACLTRLWPDLKRPETHFEVCVSHDVDVPMRYAMKDPISRLIYLKHDLSRAAILERPRVFQSFLAAQLGPCNADPYYSFDIIDTLARRYGRRHTFNFFGGRSNDFRDAGYTVEHPWARRLIRKLHDQGHAIGLHASFHTWRHPRRLAAEFATLRRVCQEEGVHQDLWTNRQHYLRWNTGTTPQALENAGLNMDTTLGFASKPGFRCGTCHPFPMFDLKARRTASLQQRPLIVMECSVLDARYLGLGDRPEEAADVMTKLKERCRRVKGCFTLLWHNDRLRKPSERALFEAMLR